MKIYLGTDHAGFEAKEKVKEFLSKEGHEVIDCGSHAFDVNDDYPDFIHPVGKGVSENKDAMGVIFGGSGQGEAMCANRYKGVRASVYYGAPGKDQVDAGGKSLNMIASTREHNNANVLSLGVRFLTDEEIIATVKLFIETPFSNGDRHIRRITKLDN
jgi:ribose 5-phosphate isomerase B